MQEQSNLPVVDRDKDDRFANVDGPLHDGRSVVYSVVVVRARYQLKSVEKPDR